MKLPILAVSVRKLLRLGALALVVGLMTLGGNQAQAALLCGAVLSTPGATTTLNHNLVCSGTDPAITIKANNITLRCKDNATLTGEGLGIFLDNVSGVTVRDCDIRGFSIGIYLKGSTENTLKKNKVTGSTSRGSGGITLVKYSDGNKLLNNTANDNNGRGVALNRASNNELKNNVASNNLFRGYGLSVSSNDNILKNNVATNNLSAGFVVSGGSTGNEFKNNKSTGSEYEGFAVLSGGNIFQGNTANNNGTFGYRDSSAGGANNYTSPTSNLCVGNTLGCTSPPGLF